jgi:hypothetical protein
MKTNFKIFGARAVAGLEQPLTNLPKRRDRRALNTQMHPSAVKRPSDGLLNIGAWLLELLWMLELGAWRFPPAFICV